ncbi:response regulator transcription factor [Olleya sp. YSTF-M6]|uniref:Response regulator transcription factor n=1 Tax=Olleya sediminilitoris TaxID=2795739 RepID=A0ABS1WL56_9FLAO|nr:response regulator transcription factor [Olleya sediminilitoris]MBL7559843.1 response regulator transcription factor [Olleya sediminilitoris]
MFKNVLVSDDLLSINQGVLTILETLNINKVQEVQYCDDAYLKIKKSILDNQPIDLLITDLSYKKDHRDQKLNSGEDLIMALYNEYPKLNVIVYSIEDRLQKVRTLVNKYNAKAYVCKGRKGLVELSKAIETVYAGEKYLSPQIQSALSSKSNIEITDFDIELLQQLSCGLSQDDISKFLKTNNISPFSLSSVEKKINKLKIQFEANNTIHLVSIAKDLGLI